MRRTMTSLTLFGLLTVAGCGDTSMIEGDKSDTVSTEPLTTARFHIDGFKKSKSGAT